MYRMLSTIVLAAGFLLTPTTTQAGHFHKQKSADCCCVCQQKTCKLNVDVKEVEETCFEVECEDVCIPPVRFWWECGPSKRCPKVRTVAKLVTEKKTKKVCVYDWEVVTVCRNCYQNLRKVRCHELGLNQDATPEQIGLSMPEPVIDPNTPTSDSGLVTVKVTAYSEQKNAPKPAEGIASE
ncbi:hypothetical protein FF011L_48090 [Roseimaritima multifibrata]|uniref:Uncharacterized protein n=1 Tax=Roseimaritima multifibrata TaxID=1930274 RepID=A0A517MM97_9BACT|nr:hypothetical protein [Roseimaritima multifibrata]QDS96005.1 hypothetical protein FF011L_48090 [Roseimaritima multifibrata]